jgi:thiol-disulfide isomerase/thioredoxin
VGALSPAYPPSTRARARALAARAQAALTRKDASAVADLDAALVLLASADAGERVPLYTLRLTAMEAAGAEPEEVRVFLQQHRDDPAATIAAEAALTAVQKLAGQPAPPLRLKRLDGKPGEITLADLRGAQPAQAVLIDVFATWHKPCALTAPAVSALAKRWRAKGVAVLGVSLDNKDTLAALSAWIATYAIDYPVVGDGLGWDSEFAAAWHIDSIPRLILVDAQGLIVTADLGGATVAEVERNDDAISQLLHLSPPLHLSPLLEQAPPPVNQQNPPAAVDVIP